MVKSIKQYADELERKQQQNQRAGLTRCADCNQLLRESVTGIRTTERGHVCSDCYFKAMGEWVTGYPIVTPPSETER